MNDVKKLLVISATALFATGSFAQKGMEGMEGMGNMNMGKNAEATTQGAHKATATVKKVDGKAGVVTLSHGPVATLNWPAMTMGFKVRDKSLMPKLTEGKKVDVEFTKQGDDYVVTSVK